jgi:hypothetical protein
MLATTLSSPSWSNGFGDVTPPSSYSVFSPHVNETLSTSSILRAVLAFIAANGGGPALYPEKGSSLGPLIPAAAGYILGTSTVTLPSMWLDTLRRYVAGRLNLPELQHQHVIAAVLLWTFTFRHGI